MLIRADFKPKAPLKGLPESYTIFGAICWGVSLLYGDGVLRSMLSEFRDSPPFLISSPVFKKENRSFFPKPILEDDWEDIKSYKDYAERKKVKRIRYIDEDAFRKVLEGVIRTERELWSSLKEREDEGPAVSSVNRPHASINRITWTTEGGGLYNEEVLYIGSPFSVFIYFRNTRYMDMVKASLRLTQLGGNKTTGMGYVEVEFREGERWIVEALEREAARFITLSPIFIDPAFNLRESFYETFTTLPAVDNFYALISKRVWKRKSIYISTGSQIVVKERKEDYGELKPVLRSDNITIYHYGLAFPLHMREER